ncbi:MAG: helix-turn-helix domain-containing protein [Paracoccaceae bacterium]|nr:helix-turn-helix domain-containing protein [Paracoccaceae bacterium]
MTAVFSDSLSIQATQLENKVLILVSKGVSLTTISTTIEPFQQANKLLGREKFILTLVSLTEKNPLTSAGVPVPCQVSSRDVFDHHDKKLWPDLAILCCGQAIETGEKALLHEFLRKLARVSAPVFALGASSAVAAAAGMIKNGKCAAHWKTIGPMREEFPGIDFMNVLFKVVKLTTSCAGELASFDLILGFIETTCGPRISGEVCNHFITCGRRSGSSVQMLSGDELICEDERFQEALEIMMANIETPLTVDDLAQQLGFSSRQIERIFARNGFESPHKYYQKLRLNRARQLIEQNRMSILEIALACGYENQSHFGRSYKKTFGLSPKDVRAQARTSFAELDRAV